ncbi:hypothetical protein PsaNZ64_21065 [Pseudomonas syringae pv. actinidiae]|uniref:Uncharacterized protein n=1 Tax=Pseudomonas syringae pv. actinidiae TaxID=103796 RepID=A0A2P0QFX8_PSESF|nr:hypothetical protein [Pseudomonas syringae]ARO45296.1 hypothetical protein [Pseudomonas syringae pv. actinidiae]OKS70524.1 hypothetical protein PsaNZ64_21065 [Pseudomonas syringae pv. actinidiae]
MATNQPAYIEPVLFFFSSGDQLKQAKIAAVVKAVNVNAEVACQYLEAEEWSVDDAVCDIRAERKMGLL